MSSRRTLILIAAVVVGAISAYLVFNYVNSADDRARANAREVDIIKVQKEIPKGLSGREAVQQGALVHTKIPAEFKPQTAITDESIIADKVAVANYTNGQILVDGMFADPIDNQITFAGRVSDQCGAVDPGTGKPAQCVAVTVSVDQVRGVAGVIVPGDLVNIMVLPETSYCAQASTAKGAVVSGLDPGQPGGVQNKGEADVCNPARVLYQAVKVLFVDKSAIPQPGEVTASGTNTATPNGQAQTVTNTGLITLEVPAQAAQLIASITPDNLYLTLLPANYAPEALPKLDPYPAQLPGEDPNLLTPYGPAGIQNQR
ncbi:MAG TPA: RcpC/CpaB family pilus assembly protein [Acidimicrobiales bacterium]